MIFGILWIFWIFFGFFGLFWGVYEDFLEWTTPRLLSDQLSLATNFQLCFGRYKWTKLKLMYEINGYHRVSGPQTCKLAMASLVEDLKRHNISYDLYDLETNKYLSAVHYLRQQLGLDYGGESIWFRARQCRASFLLLWTNQCIGAGRNWKNSESMSRAEEMLNVFIHDGSCWILELIVTTKISFGIPFRQKTASVDWCL